MLVANGPWSQHAADWLGTEVPVIPLRGQIMHVSPLDGVLMPRYAISTRPVTCCQRRVATSSQGTTEERVGFDPYPTMEAQNGILEAVIRFAPNVLDAPIRDLTACLRPYSLDETPILGPVPGTESPFLLTSHGYKGITLASSRARRWRSR